MNIILAIAAGVVLALLVAVYLLVKKHAEVDKLQADLAVLETKTEPVIRAVEAAWPEPAPQPAAAVSAAVTADVAGSQPAQVQ